MQYTTKQRAIALKCQVITNKMFDYIKLHWKVHIKEPTATKASTSFINEIQFFVVVFLNDVLFIEDGSFHILYIWHKICLMCGLSALI